jgi:nitroreductase
MVPAEFVMPASETRLSFLTHRTSAIRLSEPAPDHGTLRELLGAACTVPDHGRLRPYRFVVVGGDARERFGQALADAAVAANPGATAHAEKIKNKAFFAPVLVALLSSPRQGSSIPVWEQEATAACAGYAVVLAAEALGFGAVWKSAPVHEGEALQTLLHLSPHERFLGWVNIGTRADRPLTRPVVDVEALITTL